jgi:septum formation protein
MLSSVLDELNQKRIILASASKNRQDIIEKVGLKVEVSPSTFEENLPHTDFETSLAYV